jgi:hypothetical protein
MVDGSDALALEGLSLAIVVDYLGIFPLNWYGLLLSCYHLFQVKVIVLGARWEV